MKFKNVTLSADMTELIGDLETRVKQRTFEESTSRMIKETPFLVFRAVYPVIEQGIHTTVKDQLMLHTNGNTATFTFNISRVTLYTTSLDNFVMNPRDETEKVLKRFYNRFLERKTTTYRIWGNRFVYHLRKTKPKKWDRSAIVKTNLL